MKIKCRNLEIRLILIEYGFSYWFLNYSVELIQVTFLIVFFLIKVIEPLRKGMFTVKSRLNVINWWRHFIGKIYQSYIIRIVVFLGNIVYYEMLLLTLNTVRCVQYVYLPYGRTSCVLNDGNDSNQFTGICDCCFRRNEFPTPAMGHENLIRNLRRLRTRWWYSMQTSWTRISKRNKGLKTVGGSK